MEIKIKESEITDYWMVLKCALILPIFIELGIDVVKIYYKEYKLKKQK